MTITMRLALATCVATTTAVGSANLLGAPRSQATQGTPAPPLYNDIAHADRALFDAFNARDLEGVMAYFSEDVEFYHDKDGRETFADVRAGFERMFKGSEVPTRELVPGSLHVYPVPRYGALEVGSHRFCHVEKGKQDCGVFDFTQVWQQQGGRWRLTRVISYGH